MTWIKTIPFQEASGVLKKLYNRVKGPEDKVDNILMAHSLRPHTLAGHMQLYKAVLHHRDNVLPKHFLETIGLYVSHMNRCLYCVEHHFQGLRKQLNDPKRSRAVKRAMERNEPEVLFTGKDLVLLQYARMMTQRPFDVNEEWLEEMRSAGCTDGEILEVNQVTAYFNYANRTVLGLGVDLTGDVLGLSPNSDDPDDWGHE